MYRGADKSLARPGRKQANVSVRMAWISFGALPCRKKSWWQQTSRCCWNRARPLHAFELVSFLVGLRTYQHPSRNERVTIQYLTFHICTYDKHCHIQHLYLFLSIALPIEMTVECPIKLHLQHTYDFIGPVLHKVTDTALDRAFTGK